MEMNLGIKTRKSQPSEYRALHKDSHCRNRNEAFEGTQDLIVSGIVWNLIGLGIVIGQR